MVNGIELTKIQARLMRFFASHITRQISINGLANELGMNVSLVHRAVTSLIKDYNLIKVTPQKLLTVNYYENHDILSYIEYLRRESCLSKASNRTIAEFREEVRDKLKHEYFIMILFGSAVDKSDPGDYDILFIFEDHEKIKRREKALEVMASGHSSRFDINIVAVESIYEMAAKRGQKNILNELLDKHIILHGAEDFYRLLKDARQ